eukprot:9519826-Alexandrium_andersonii.AAC.1
MGGTREVVCPDLQVAPVAPDWAACKPAPALKLPPAQATLKHLKIQRIHEALRMLELARNELALQHC